jgi:hypothetical protein
MKVHVELPESLAAREYTTVDALLASSLAATIDHPTHRPAIAEHAARVDWAKVDAILASVPASRLNRAMSGKPSSICGGYDFREFHDEPSQSANGETDWPKASPPGRSHREAATSSNPPSSNTRCRKCCLVVL